jgi:hypothetical protein
MALMKFAGDFSLQESASFDESIDGTRYSDLLIGQFLLDIEVLLQLEKDQLRIGDVSTVQFDERNKAVL